MEPNFSKQFLEQLAGDLSDVADALDDAGKPQQARDIEKARTIIASIKPRYEK